MLCSNTLKNPGTAHKKGASEGISCILFDSHLSARQYMDTIYCDLHIQYVNVEVDFSSLMYWRWKACVLALCTGWFCGFRGDNYKGYKITKA